MFGIRREAPRLAVQLVFHADHLGDLLNAARDIRGIRTPVAQREGKIVAHGHRVVDHRELEHLRDVALGGGGVGHVHIVKQDATLRRLQQPRNDVEQRRLAATGSAQKRIGFAVDPVVVQFLEGEIILMAGVRQIGMRKVIKRDLGHYAASA